VRNAWEGLDTAKEKLDYLRTQSDISAEFLELARKERTLGTRSLIDVLAGETSLINASADAAAAETDVAVAVYKLLNAMGQLSVDAVY
jgi:outer membrane protein, adhesin transport system